MNIFKKAKENQEAGMGYRARRFAVLWKNKNIGHNWIGIDWGIRWSITNQIFPIWNTSNNSQRSIMFGIWKLYFEIKYHRKGGFNQNRKLFLRRPLWKFYQLVS